MNIYVTTGESEASVKVDFISEVALPTPSLYLMIYSLNTYTYIMGDNPMGPDVRTDNYSKFRFVKLDHIIYGYFIYNDKKVSAQVGGFNNRTGIPCFVNVLLSHDYGEVIFKDTFGNGCGEPSEFMIVDLEDFNKTRQLIGQDNYTLNEYLARKLAKVWVNDNGLSLDDETSLFSPLVGEFDPSTLMTSKGMAIFLEEQLKK